MTIQSLIDKQDNFEIIRDQIAAILASESASQQTLADQADKNPNDWKLRVFTERSNPWEQLLNEQTDKTPIVNVWFDNSNFDPSASNIVERQKTEGIFNIDCYGYGLATDDPSCGHNPGDKEAAFTAHRAVRLVRNILMSADYTYLGLRGVVWGRWPDSITSLQPQIDGRQMQQLVAVRLAFRVVFNEFSPQISGQDLEFVSIDVMRTEDGEIVVEADYDYTQP